MSHQSHLFYLFFQCHQLKTNEQKEPTDEWTIEELLHWCLLQSQHKTVSKRDEIINAFQELFDIGKQEILELQNEVCRIHNEREERGEVMAMQMNNLEEGEEGEELQQQQQEEQQRKQGGGEGGGGEMDNENKYSDGGRVTQGIQNDENQHPNSAIGTSKPTTSKAVTFAKKTTATSASTSKSTKPTTVQIEIIKGPHTGMTYNLNPSYKKPCWVGRSSSKKFRERGISLNKDDEVSTTHGKFHIYPSGSDGKLVFTDTGSTNGTIYNNEEIEDNVPLELVDGMVLVLGNSDLLIHLI